MRICKIKHITNFFTGGTPPTEQFHWFNGNIPWANISDLKGGTLANPAKSITLEAVEKFSIPLAQPGDLLFSFKLSIGAVALVGKAMATNEAIAVFREAPGFHIHWAKYALPHFVVKNARMNIYNAPLLNRQSILNATIAVPSEVEQRNIAAYLDAKIGAIDAAIDRAKQQLEHVKAYRQTVITDAVSPADTARIPLKRVANCYSYGANPKSDNPAYYGVDVDATAPWATIADITADFHLRSTKHRITPAAIADYRMQPVPAGTLLMSMYGSMGRLARNSAPVYTNTAILAFQPNPALITDDYLYWSLQALYSHWPTIATKTTQMNLSQDKVLSTEVVLPSLPVQAEIASFLNEKISAIDKTIATLQQLLTSLPLYRQSLISDVVTGQLAVPQNFTAEPTAMLTAQ